MKQGSSYELLTQQVYQTLLDCEWPGKNIRVQHDIKLTGSSGQEHQIDIYWEYELAGVKSKVAIECKDYSKPLAIGKVRDFYGVLADLKDVKGIIIASNGFQKGAKGYAKSWGINLKELSVSNEIPVIAEIDNHIHIAIRRRLFQIDEEWAKEMGYNIDSYRKRLSWMSMNGEEWLHAAHIPLQTKDSIIYDAQGNKVASIDELESGIGKEIIGGINHTFSFKDAYVKLDSNLFKIKEVLITDKEEDHYSTVRVTANNFVKAILKDAIDGKIQNILCPDIYVTDSNPNHQKV